MSMGEPGLVIPLMYGRYNIVLRRKATSNLKANLELESIRGSFLFPTISNLNTLALACHWHSKFDPDTGTSSTQDSETEKT